jgi:hypothetical protein
MSSAFAGPVSATACVLAVPSSMVATDGITVKSTFVGSEHVIVIVAPSAVATMPSSTLVAAAASALATAPGLAPDAIFVSVYPDDR